MEKDIRVLLASPKGNVSGGIARWTEHVLRYYNTIENTSVQLSFFNTARKKQAPDGIIKRIFRALLEYPRKIWDLSMTLKKKDYDLLHFTSSASLGLLRDIIIIFIAKKTKTKTVIHFRFGRTPEILKKNNWECVLLKYVVSNVDKAIFIDKSSYDSIYSCGFKNVVLLPNPLSSDIFTKIKELGDVEREYRTVLFVGHCYVDKGVFELAEVCKLLPDVKLKFVGSVSSSIKNKLLESSSGNIKVVGEESYDLIIEDMLKCDLFVLPSYTEGFPNVILEAMACSCAIIATNVGAIPEMLDENGVDRCGIIIPPRNVEKLKDAIITLFENDELKQLYRNKAKQRVCNLYTMDVVWAKMVEIWKSI